MRIKSQTVLARGAVLDRVLDARWRASGEGLNRQAFGRFHAAQMKTAWASRCQSTCALIAGETILASAERYELAGVFDGRPMRVCGIGSVRSEPSPQGAAHARTLIETILDGAEAAGVEMAVLFSQPPAAPAERFEAIPLTDLTLAVTQSRRGAPMTTVRGGEERDLAAIVAMGRVRAGAQRLHLDRDVDFLQYIITTKRLLAGLAPANARQLHFFIAEEGITAAAYVIVSVAGHTWTLEECGDRDPSGARVGALLQALIAREPAERRPTIHAWLPPGFQPPQVTIASAVPSPATIGVRMLNSGAIARPGRRRRRVLARQLSVARAGVRLTQRCRAIAAATRRACSQSAEAASRDIRETEPAGRQRAVTQPHTGARFDPLRPGRSPGVHDPHPSSTPRVAASPENARTHGWAARAHIAKNMTAIRPAPAADSSIQGAGPFERFVMAEATPYLCATSQALFNCAQAFPGSRHTVEGMFKHFGPGWPPSGWRLSS